MDGKEAHPQRLSLYNCLRLGHHRTPLHLLSRVNLRLGVPFQRSSCSLHDQPGLMQEVNYRFFQLFITNAVSGNENFPTPVRNLGYSFIQMWNRVGVIMAPFITVFVR